MVSESISYNETHTQVYTFLSDRSSFGLFFWWTLFSDDMITTADGLEKFQSKACAVKMRTFPQQHGDWFPPITSSNWTNEEKVNTWIENETRTLFHRFDTALNYFTDLMCSTTTLDSFLLNPPGASSNQARHKIINQTQFKLIGIVFSLLLPVAFVSVSQNGLLQFSFFGAGFLCVLHNWNPIDPFHCLIRAGMMFWPGRSPWGTEWGLSPSMMMMGLKGV